MADLDPDVIRQVEEELKKLEERFGITIGNLKSFGEAANVFFVVICFNFVHILFFLEKQHLNQYTNR
jgi:hypothetical protein